MFLHTSQLAAARIAAFDDGAFALARAFWPGPLTIVAPIRDDGAVCDLARAGLDTVAIRVPRHPVSRAVLAAFGGAVVAPSANRSGRPSPTTFADAVAETGDKATVALDGGPCAVGLESTVVSMLEGQARLLRPGAVTRVQLQQIITDMGASAYYGSAANYKKGELVESMAKYFKRATTDRATDTEKQANAWLPEAMAFPAIDPDRKEPENVEWNDDSEEEADGLDEEGGELDDEEYSEAA